jgi:hypothetical protein
MAVIYLKHFIHGSKVATMEAEAEYDEKHGWVRYNPDTPSAPEEVASENTLRLRRKNRKVESVPEGV